jgi:hypothetical protein
MVTPELLEYVRAGVAKGHSREEIKKILISGGGWSETDLSEVFRIVIPMMGVPVPEVVYSVEPEGHAPVLAPATSAPGRPKTKLKVPLHDLVFVILVLFCVVSWYFYQPQITSFWDGGVKSSQEFFSNSWNSYANFFKEISFPTLKFPSFHLPSFDFGKFFGPTEKGSLANNVIIPRPEETGVKNCGISTAPKLDAPSLYLNDPVLACLGASAVNCENAQGMLRDDFFPTIFEIIKLPNSCNFKLSYEIDSTLTDITGKKLALQYISCPLSIVKAIDNSQPIVPQFFSVDKTNLSKYASQIYFYGTLGLFVENKLDQNKIQALGCSGDYINSVIASYQKMQSKK